MILWLASVAVIAGWLGTIAFVATVLGSLTIRRFRRGK
jgi:hypothetical protein